MTTLILAVMLQSVISVEAGRVNYAEGNVNVIVNENVPEGALIRTGADGFVEVLLNPGSFLRLGEGSEAVLEETELTGIRIRLVSGVAILEAAEILDEYPISVATGDLETEIVEDGLYRFENGVASVIEGRLDLPDSDLAWSKGWSLYFDRVYRARKTLPNQLISSLDTWSALRAASLARANTRAFNSLVRQTGMSYPSLAAWYWLPGLGAWTFFPNSGYRSPYGYRYYTTTDLRRGWIPTGRARSGGSGGTGGSGTAGSGPAPSPTPSQSGNAGGGVPSPPAPTFRDIVPSRSGPVTQQPN